MSARGAMVAGRGVRWSVTAAVTAAMLVLVGLPAAADDPVGVSPSPSPQPVVEPAAGADGADSPADTSAEDTPSPDDVPTDSPALLVDDDVAAGVASEPEVTGQPVPDAELPAPLEVTGAAEVTPVPASDQVLQVAPDGTLDASMLAGETLPGSIVVGAEVAGLRELTEALYGEDAGLLVATGRPDMLVQQLDRAAVGDELAVDVTPLLDAGRIPGAAFSAQVLLNGGLEQGWVDLAFDASGVANAYGGDYGDRLTLVALPACALTTPEEPSCLVGVELDTAHVGDGVLRAMVPASSLSVADVAGRYAAPRLVNLAGAELTEGLVATNGLPMASSMGGSIVVAVSGASSAAGNFKATDLAPRGTWGVSEPAGGFTYQIPIAVPPVQTGAAPSLALSYSSQATDGRTSASNNQAGPIGEGWSMPVDFIERVYKPCTDDGEIGNAQQCWDSPYAGVPDAAVYVLSLGGKVEELSYVSRSGTTEVFAAASDPTLKVTHHWSTGTSRNADNNGEYFTVETSDGSTYYFGFAPTSAVANDPDFVAANSVAWEPVWSNNTGEPHFTGSDTVVTNQAYRLYLDVAVDASNNATTYSYKQDKNWYAAGSASYEYVRDTQLSRIAYGQVFDATAGTVTTPQAKVEFDLVRRCVEGAQYKDALAVGVAFYSLCATPSTTTAASYPDVPVDLICAASGTCNALQNSPTYFSTVRLNQINTFARSAAGAFVPVETTQLITVFPTTKDGSARSLWLDSVYTKGWGAPNNAADDVQTYLTKFSGTALNNRVDWNMTPVAGVTPTRPMDRLRISNVYTDLGGRIEVTYARADVPSSLTGALASQTCPQVGEGDTTGVWAAWRAGASDAVVNSTANTWLCFATTRGTDVEIYHNYVVTAVTVHDLVGGQPDMTTSYEYGGNPFHARNSSVLYAANSTGEDKDYTSYRGFLTVSSTQGYLGDAVAQSRLAFGDFDGNGVTDLFTVAADGSWRTNLGAASGWTQIHGPESLALADLRFGDFNGDGKTDVFSRLSTGQWRYSSAGTGAWVNLALDAGTPLSDLRFADFNGDGKTDVFSRLSTGQWRYSSGGAAGYANLQADGTTALADLRFADFNGDGKDDIFSRSSTGQWRYSSGGAAVYTNLTSDGAVPLSALRLADVTGDGKADVITQNANGTWKFSSAGTAAWAPLGAPADVTLAQVEFADMTGDGKADLFTLGVFGQHKVSSAANAAWTVLSAPRTTAAVTTNQYFRGAGGSVTSLYDGSTARVDTDVRLQGRLESSRTLDGAGQLAQASRADYTVASVSAPNWESGVGGAEHNPHIVLATGSTSKVVDGSWSSTTQTVTTFDVPNNVPNHFATYQPTQSVTSVTDSRADQPVKTQCSATAYASSQDPYLVVPVASASYEGQCGTGVLTAKAEVGYDGGTPGATTQPLSRGLVTRERAYTTATDFTTAQASYDDRGRIVQAWMPNDVPDGVAAATPTVQWSYSEGQVPWTTTVTRALGATATTYTEPGHGNTVATKGATDKDWTHYQYDGLGLLVAGWAPAQWGQQDAPNLASDIPTVMYRYDIYANGPALRDRAASVTTAPFIRIDGTSFKGADETGTTRRSITFLDGLGRAIEQQAVAPDGSGGRTITATRYNEFGQVDWTSGAFAKPGQLTVLNAQGKANLVNPTLAELPAATDATYDSRGRTIATTSMYLGAPLSVDETQVTSTTTYAGPVTTSTAADGSTRTVTVDTLGRTIAQVVSADAAHTGQAAQTTAYAYDTLTTAGQVGFQKVTVTDPEGAATVFVSNLAGQRVQMVDPNAGTTDYEYDANGQSTVIVSEAGTLTMGYDVLGRLVSRTSANNNGERSSEASWTYATPALIEADEQDDIHEADLGLLVESSSTTVTSVGDLITLQSTEYNDLHQVVSTTMTLPTSPAGAPDLLGDLSGQTVTSTFQYDDLGQVIATGLEGKGGLPAEYVVTGYRLNGTAKSLTLTDALASPTVTTPLVTSVAYSAVGQLTSRTYGNGVTRSYMWSDTTRALMGLSATFPDLTATPDAEGKYPTYAVQQDTFTRDVMGRITQSTSEVPVAVDADGAGGADPVQQVTAECFSYDGFNRLAAAWTVADASAPVCVSQAPADASAAGWDASDTAYAATYEYSLAGRITSLTQSMGGAVADTATYDYDPPVGAEVFHPAAVTSIDHTTGADDGFAYDDAGRMVSRTVGGVTTALTWDVTSSLTETNGQGGHVIYAYDASGQRVVQARMADAGGAGGTATAYTSAGQLDDADTASASTGDVTGTRYYTIGGSAVAVRTVTDTEAGRVVNLAFLFDDEQGSTSVMMPAQVDASGAVAPATLADASAATRTAYTPYGALRGDDNEAVDRGWLGQVEDRVDGASGTGLTYLNARYYDPATMRFISPDPLIDRADPTTLDAYRYAANNPVVFLDPSGRIEICTPMPGGSTWCRTLGEMIFGEDTVEDRVYAGTLDGAMDTTAAVGQAFTPEGASANAKAFREDPGGAFESAIMGATGMTQFQNMAACMTGPILCDPYEVGYNGGELGTNYSLITLGAVRAPELRPALAKPSVFKPAEIVTAAVSETRPATTGTAIVRLGQAGEAAVQAAYNIGPKARVYVNGRLRIFDGLTRYTVSEIKNVAYQSLTQQILDSYQWAVANNRRFVLYVRPNTRLSAPLQELMTDPKLKTELRYIP